MFFARLAAASVLMFVFAYRFLPDMTQAVAWSLRDGLFIAVVWTVLASEAPAARILKRGARWSLLATAPVVAVVYHLSITQQTADYMRASLPTAMIVILAVFVVSFSVGVVRGVRARQQANDPTQSLR
jgi:hypothetical protein